MFWNVRKSESKKRKVSIVEFKAKIDLFQMRAKYNEDKYKFIDNKVNTFLIKKYVSFNVKHTDTHVER